MRREGLPAISPSCPAFCKSPKLKEFLAKWGAPTMTFRESGLSVLVGSFLCGCGTSPERPATSAQLTADEMIAVQTRVLDCEMQAANRYDDGKSPIAAVAERIQGICGPEILKARLAFHVRINDPDLDSDEFKRIIGVVERERKGKGR
jgi:hypothetical protein